MTALNPFADLGLPADPGLTDEQVRSAWRQIAAATHPDRPGGGDAARYAAASAAYAQLRTGWGRSEAFADLADAGTAMGPPPVIPVVAPEPPHPLPGLAGLLYLPSRIRRGRPFRMTLRAAIAATLALLVLHLIPGQPAGPALVTALITWFALTTRADLAPPPKR
jgi:hypothetical protein